MSACRLSAQSTPSASTPENTPEQSLTPIDEPQFLQDDLYGTGNKGIRPIICLVQCHLCGGILNDAHHLPCGYTICKGCVPPSQIREGVTWPLDEARKSGFQCPIGACSKSHSALDVVRDITINKVVGAFDEVMKPHQAAAQDSNQQFRVVLFLYWDPVAHCPGPLEHLTDSRQFGDDRVTVLYSMAEAGNLPFNHRACLIPIGEDDVWNAVRAEDKKTLKQLQEATRKYFDCQVCCDFLDDPLTTSCGHTFCRHCVRELMDRSIKCPVCRAQLDVHPVSGPTASPSNVRLVKFITSFWGAKKPETRPIVPTRRLPLFVGRGALPTECVTISTLEARYCTMFESVWNDHRRFVMVQGQAYPEAAGQSHLSDMGVYMRMTSLEMYDSGLCKVEAVGEHRLTIKSHRWSGGVIYARVTKAYDVPIAVQEDIEATETSGIDQVKTYDPETMSTLSHYIRGSGFIMTSQAEDYDWLIQSQIATNDLMPWCPDELSWWMAAVFPLDDEQREKFLRTTTLRERYKMLHPIIEEYDRTERWIKRLREIAARKASSKCALM